MPIALIFGLQPRAYRTARVGSKTYRNRCPLMLGPTSFADCWSGINARVRMPTYSHAAPTARLCLHLLGVICTYLTGQPNKECAPLYVRPPEGDERGERSGTHTYESMTNIPICAMLQAYFYVWKCGLHSGIPPVKSQRTTVIVRGIWTEKGLVRVRGNQGRREFGTTTTPRSGNVTSWHGVPRVRPRVTPTARAKPTSSMRCSATRWRNVPARRHGRLERQHLAYYQHPRARTWSSTPTSTAWRTRVDGSSAALDRVARTVSSVVFASDPVNGDTYGSGEWVAVRVKFDEDMLLPAPPQPSLDIGGVASYGGIRPRPIRESPLPQQALRGPPGGLFGYRRRLHRREHAESEQRRHPGRDLQPNSATPLPTSSDASPMRPPVASWGTARASPCQQDNVFKTARQARRVLWRPYLRLRGDGISGRS